MNEISEKGIWMAVLRILGTNLMFHNKGKSLAADKLKDMEDWKCLLVN